MRLASLRGSGLGAFAFVGATLAAACGGGKVVVLGLGEGGASATTTTSGAGGSIDLPSTIVKCDGGYVDTAHDPKNCGKCGQACPDGQVCSAGTCAVACGSSEAACTDAMGKPYCADTVNDPKNCGKCGQSCAMGESCVNGTCNVGCFGGTELCGKSCTNTQIDPANCGMCGNACMPPPFADAVCHAGKCDGVCKDGFGDCNNKAADGCETILASSTENCGSCGNACAVVHGKPICDANMCLVATCDPGYANCDNDAASCETNTTNDAKNCGGCKKACNVGETCVNSICNSLPASCRLVNGIKWCTDPNNTAGLNCNTTCANVGMTPIPDNTVWYNAQDTVAECQAIRDAFGYNQPISMSSFTYACAEVLPGSFLCSNFSGCPQEHRTNSDGSPHQGICPCQ